MKIGKSLKKRKNKNVILKEEINVFKDWNTSLIIFLTVLVLLAATGFYLFMDEDNREHSIGNTDITPNSVINRDLLNDTIDFYTEKEKRFKEAKDEFDGAPNI